MWWLEENEIWRGGPLHLREKAGCEHLFPLSPPDPSHIYSPICTVKGEEDREAGSLKIIFK
jgi:hypothetical protein